MEAKAPPRLVWGQPVVYDLMTPSDVNELLYLNGLINGFDKKMK